MDNLGGTGAVGGDGSHNGGGPAIWLLPVSPGGGDSGGLGGGGSSGSLGSSGGGSAGPVIPNAGGAGSDGLGGGGGGVGGGRCGRGSDLVSPSGNSDDSGCQSGESGDSDLHFDRCEEGSF